MVGSHVGGQLGPGSSPTSRLFSEHEHYGGEDHAEERRVPRGHHPPHEDREPHPLCLPERPPDLIRLHARVGVSAEVSPLLPGAHAPPSAFTWGFL